MSPSLISHVGHCQLSLSLSLTQMSQATLYNFFRSSCSYRAHIVLNLENSPYKTHSISLEKGEQNTPEYLTIQPLGMIPALVIDGEVITSPNPSP